MKQKVELIQQIRAMESLPVIRTKFVDLTETSGQGLLSEMSVAEVRKKQELHVQKQSIYLENTCTCTILPTRIYDLFLAERETQFYEDC